MEYLRRLTGGGQPAAQPVAVETRTTAPATERPWSPYAVEPVTTPEQPPSAHRHLQRAQLQEPVVRRRPTPAPDTVIDMPQPPQPAEAPSGVEEQAPRAANPFRFTRSNLRQRVVQASALLTAAGQRVTGSSSSSSSSTQAPSATRVDELAPQTPALPSPLAQLSHDLNDVYRLCVQYVAENGAGALERMRTAVQQVEAGGYKHPRIDGRVFADAAPDDARLQEVLQCGWLLLDAEVATTQARRPQPRQHSPKRRAVNIQQPSRPPSRPRTADARADEAIVTAASSMRTMSAAGPDSDALPGPTAALTGRYRITLTPEQHEARERQKREEEAAERARTKSAERRLRNRTAT